MKILMYGWEYPPNITGGLGTACYGITKGLAEQNVNVLFVVPKAFGNEDRRFATLQDAGEIPARYTESDSKKFWSKIEYKEVAARLIPYSTPEDYEKMMQMDIEQLHPGKTDGDTGFEPFSGKYGADLWKEIDRYSMVTSILAGMEKFDIIHAHDWLTFPAAISAKKISAKPLIVHIHATEFDRNNGKINKDIYDIEKKGMELSDKIITVSNYTKSIVIKEYGIHPEKIVTVHNGVEKTTTATENFKEKKLNEKVVTFLGRITFQKGPEYFIEAAYKVLQKQKNVKFVMAGRGDMKDKIVKMVEHLGITSNVSFPGFLNGDDILKLFSETDLYVMPSVSEPFGISPLEALQSKVPVIISKQSGVAEILNNAIKVDYWDINALADAIHGVLNFKSLSSILSSKGSDEVDKLTWTKAGSEIIDVYNSLLA